MIKRRRQATEDSTTVRLPIVLRVRAERQKDSGLYLCVDTSGMSPPLEHLVNTHNKAVSPPGSGNGITGLASTLNALKLDIDTLTIFREEIS